jgi:hypothetical protein
VTPSPCQCGPDHGKALLFSGTKTAGPLCIPMRVKSADGRASLNLCNSSTSSSAPSLARLLPCTGLASATTRTLGRQHKPPPTPSSASLQRLRRASLALPPPRPRGAGRPLQRAQPQQRGPPRLGPSRPLQPQPARQGSRRTRRRHGLPRWRVLRLAGRHLLRLRFGHRHCR